MVSDKVPLHVVLVAEPHVAEVTLVGLVLQVDCVYVDLTVPDTTRAFELFVADRTDVQLVWWEM